jgi:hypothetical protein
VAKDQNTLAYFSAFARSVRILCRDHVPRLPVPPPPPHLLLALPRRTSTQLRLAAAPPLSFASPRVSSFAAPAVAATSSSCPIGTRDEEADPVGVARSMAPHREGGRRSRVRGSSPAPWTRAGPVAASRRYGSERRGLGSVGIKGERKGNKVNPNSPS